MSPEEFDKRLRSSFQDEYLAPKPELWAHISSSLDQKGKKPFWYWLLPLIAVLSAGIVWLGMSLGSPENTLANSAERPVLAAPAASAEGSGHPALSTASESPLHPVAPENNPEAGRSAAVSARPSGLVASALQSRKPRHSPKQANSRAYSAAAAVSSASDPAPPAIALPAEKPEGMEEFLNFLRYAYLSRFPAGIQTYPAEAHPYLALNKPAITKTATNGNGSHSNLNSRYVFSFGIGPQLAFNTLKISNDSQNYVHKHLWNNKEMLTHNGSGLNSFATFSMRFGKKNRFSFETGLQYSLRTEEIKFNESTYDIAARDSMGRVAQYLRLNVFIIIPRIPGPGSDTTSYAAVQNFSMSASNRYHVLSIPFSFHSEHSISESTYFSAGIGGGVSLISARKTTHYDMIREKEIKTSRQSMITGSLHTRLALYTQFNDLGQIGIYTGFQTYLSPYQAGSRQYSIRMSDAQLGILFKRPLNW